MMGERMSRVGCSTPGSILRATTFGVNENVVPFLELLNSLSSSEFPFFILLQLPSVLLSLGSTAEINKWTYVGVPPLHIANHRPKGSI